MLARSCWPSSPVCPTLRTWSRTSRSAVSCGWKAVLCWTAFGRWWRLASPMPCFPIIWPTLRRSVATRSSYGQRQLRLAVVAECWTCHLRDQRFFEGRMDFFGVQFDTRCAVVIVMNIYQNCAESRDVNEAVSAWGQGHFNEAKPKYIHRKQALDGSNYYTFRYTCGALVHQGLRNMK